MSNKLIRIAGLLKKKHQAEIVQLSKKDEQLKAQLAQVEVLNQHSQKIVSFSPEQDVAAIEFKQAMYYRENLNTLLVTQRLDISKQRKQIRNEDQQLQQQLQHTSVLNKLGEKQQRLYLQQIELLDEEEIKSSVLLRHNQQVLGS